RAAIVGLMYRPPQRPAHTVPRPGPLGAARVDLRSSAPALRSSVILEIRSMKTLLAVLLLALPVLPASAQTWPAKPVKIIAPFAPGGSADTLGRLVAAQLTERLKVTFIVENRPGAGGVLGSELAAKADPDGYPLVVSGTASHVIAPLLPQGTPHDPLRDVPHTALFG